MPPLTPDSIHINQDLDVTGLQNHSDTQHAKPPYRLVSNYSNKNHQYSVRVVMTEDTDHIVSEEFFDFGFDAVRRLMVLSDTLSQDEPSFSLPRSTTGISFHGHFNRLDRHTMRKRDGAQPDEEDSFDMDIDSIESAQNSNNSPSEFLESIGFGSEMFF